MSHRFGWCCDNKHDGCPGSYVGFFVDEKGRPHTTDTRECDCACHANAS